MNRVFAVQEIKRYHCPACDGTYSYRVGGDEMKCKSCGHVYQRGEGVPKPIHSLTEANVYGQIEVLIQTNNVGILMGPIIASLKHKLKDFCDDDYLLPIGDPVAIAASAIIASKNNRGRVNFLKWDRQTRTYLKIAVQT